MKLFPLFKCLCLASFPALFLGGCSAKLSEGPFALSKANEMVVGATTREDVVDRFGMPPWTLKRHNWQQVCSDASLLLSGTEVCSEPFRSRMQQRPLEEDETVYLYRSDTAHAVCLVCNSRQVHRRLYVFIDDASGIVNDFLLETERGDRI